MKRSIARKWAAALESGDYNQGIGQLRTKSGGWCCLGVLCNLHAQAHPDIAAKQKKKTEYLGESEFPSFEVTHWAGTNRNDPYIKSKKAYLSILNDNGASFKDIAKIIRKHWKEL